MPDRNEANSFVWILASKSGDVSCVGEVPVLSNPFRIGRHQNLELTLAQNLVSGLHAQITESQGRLFIEDLGSRNGTFLNGERVFQQVEVSAGDTLQFANSVFSLRLDELEEDPKFGDTMITAALNDAQRIVEFETLMLDKQIEPYLQSIVDLRTYETIGFEVLVRSSNPQLRSPAKLFSTAEKLEREVELSELIRRVASVKFCQHRDSIVADGKKLFLNTHPRELEDVPALIASLELLKRNNADLPVVVEIHESAVTHMRDMFQLSKAARELGYEIAYDDFGAGQARFFELIEEPPSYLKFDIRLVKGLQKASSRRRNAIRQLVKMVKNLGIQCIAEGIESIEDAGACQELGFDHSQGFFFSRPAPISQWTSLDPDRCNWSEPFASS